MNLTRYRKVVDAYAPPLGHLYRSLRDQTILRKPIQTKYGFSLAGDPEIIREDWESDEKKTFLEIMDKHDVFLDIGANVGFYSCLVASHEKHTIAFEPSQRNLRFLYRNLQENQLSNVEVFPLGLAGQCGLGRIYGDDSESSFIPGWAQARKARFNLVPLTTLDIIAAYRFKEKRLFIKMDVEGFELDVLAGATDTLGLNPKPTWLVEILLRSEAIPGKINHRFYETFEVFWRQGYQCRMPDSARTEVKQADVAHWVAEGFVGSGTRDFLFCR